VPAAELTFFLLPAMQTEPGQHMGPTLVTNQFSTDAGRGVIVGDPSLNGLSFSAYWTVSIPARTCLVCWPGMHVVGDSKT
jgi:hypothetical protein